MRSQTPIYFVTVMFIDKSKLDVQPQTFGEERYKRIRCWGWFYNEEDAIKCIKENWTDIYEIGYYNLALIEKSFEGISNIRHSETKWFDVNFVDQDTYIVTEIERPQRFKSIGGFSFA